MHTAIWVSEDDRAFATRVARYCARNPFALERPTSDRTAKAVTYRSDKSDGPTAGTETVDPLEFLARVLVHIPDKGHVTKRSEHLRARLIAGERVIAWGASGALRAIVGGCRIEQKGFDRALRAKRQPGSTFKLFVYVEALRQGFTAASMLEDEPIEIDIGRPETDSAWEPPAGIETNQIDIGPGKLASDWCGPSRREYFVRGSAPRTSCANSPDLAVRDAEPPAWHDSNSGAPGEIDPAQVAKAVSGVLEAPGGSAKVRAAAGRIVSELRKAKREAARKVKPQSERMRRELRALPQPSAPPRPPR